MKCLRVLFVILGLCAAATVAGAADPWPGESWNVASNLTYLGPTTSPWTNNLSGAYWNPVTRRLWLANNSGTFTVLKEDGAGGFLNEGNYSPAGNLDLEGITQADPAADRVYLLVERAEEIRAYSTNGLAKETWDLTPTIGALGNDGTEGIAFIPNVWLAASGFRDMNGDLYSNSVHGVDGLGGIMLVAVQDPRGYAGYVYAVDLKKDGTYTFVGKYKTSRNESCDLAFDASIGRLYILHNIDGNILEVTDLTSSTFGTDRMFTTLREFQVPSSSNIEGFGLTPALNNDNTLGDGWCFFTDDNALDGALRWFKQLPSSLSIQAGSNQSAPISTTVPVPPSVLVQDAFKNPLPAFAVTFAVTSGAGSVTGASTTTQPSGIAAVGSWTLGPTPGTNTLLATGTGLSGSPLTFSATGSKTKANVFLSSLAAVYDGNPKNARAITVPVRGLAVGLTYDGSSVAPSNAGNYAVVATIVDVSYEGSTNGTFVIAKAAATVTLGDLAATYDGTPKSASATTVPEGLITRRSDR